MLYAGELIEGGIPIMARGHVFFGRRQNLVPSFFALKTEIQKNFYSRGNLESGIRAHIFKCLWSPGMNSKE
jgi:hypothetical protein